jgi:hypothetical protein
MHDTLVVVRDSKNPHGGVLRFTVAEWLVFLDGVRAGEFEPPMPDHGSRRKHEAISS